LLNADLRLGGRTFAYLVGDNAMSAELLEFSAIESPLSTLDAVVIDPQDKQRILAVVEKHAEYLQRRKEWGFDDVIRYGRGILMLFWGTPGTGKTMTAHGVAHALGKRILNVDIPAFINLRDGDRFLSALFREARLQNAVLFFDECEGLLSSRNAGNSLMNVLLTEIERFEGVAILATNLAHQLDPALERRILVKVAFPEPDREMRAEIWRKHLPARAPIAPDVDVEALATRYELSGGYIKNAVLTALANVVHQGGSPPEIAMRHLETAAQAQLQRWGEGSAKRSFPKARLADVVLPPSVAERVHEVVDAARNHSLVVDRWALGAHFSHGKGISAMFTGAPGTGKTLCAEAIAGELGRPLVSASVPSLLSKWVGESEKNISALFAEAAAAGAVLFFDEADALLSARGRTNASRHDDSIVDVMLVGIERFRGLVLLATNLAGKLDPALARRIGWTLEFPMPGSAERAAIWAGMLPVTVPLKGRVDFAHLGREYRLSGGQIKNAVMRAAFRAARLGVALDHGQLCKAAAEEAGVVVSAGVVEC
jgi:SpoVK/Ycf46/Vps4 family AAA+-type ATPase